MGTLVKESFHSERIAIYAVEPGSFVPLHGTSQCHINVHLGLSGLDGAKISVGGIESSWEAGGVLAFQDSFDHEVWHRGNETRFVLAISVIHPGLKMLYPGILLAFQNWEKLMEVLH